jgi:hypothetical protein
MNRRDSEEGEAVKEPINMIHCPKCNGTEIESAIIPRSGHRRGVLGLACLNCKYEWVLGFTDQNKKHHEVWYSTGRGHWPRGAE